ncbi:MAG TPA: hypothetical protein VMG80_06075 [Solirubrobacteraceae bacterium]|nr:hypothetical protein [Solirubrobacteraceae bacterium]
MSRLRRIATASATAALLALTLAPAALAENDGRGSYGATDDKVVTNAGFMVIAFFALFVFVMSTIQWRLEKRKAAGKAAKKQLRNVDFGGGW